MLKCKGMIGEPEPRRRILRLLGWPAGEREGERRVSLSRNRKVVVEIDSLASTEYGVPLLIPYCWQH